MQAHDYDPSKPARQTLSAPQVADRMGLNTRQLQDLRLRGIGPPIVQRGLSIHYDLADVKDIEQHEAMAIIEQVLASDRPLTLLRTLVDLAGFKLSPILQQVSGYTSSPATGPIQPTSELPKSAKDVIAPAAEPEPRPANPATLTVITSPTTAWCLVHSRPVGELKKPTQAEVVVTQGDVRVLRRKSWRRFRENRGQKGSNQPPRAPVLTAPWHTQNAREPRVFCGI